MQTAQQILRRAVLAEEQFERDERRASEAAPHPLAPAGVAAVGKQ